MFVDFLGDKGGARLAYGGLFEFFDSELNSEKPEYEIPNMYEKQDRAFFEEIATGEKNRNYIDEILESAKLLDVLYRSAEQREEIKL